MANGTSTSDSTNTGWWTANLPPLPTPTMPPLPAKLPPMAPAVRLPSIRRDGSDLPQAPQTVPAQGQPPPATSFDEGQRQAQTSGQPVEVQVPGGAGPFWVNPDGSVQGTRPGAVQPSSTTPTGQPRSYTGILVPPLNTPAAIPIPQRQYAPTPDELYSKATPAGRLLIGPESSWQNMVNDVPTSSGYAQGYYQITTGTWNDFAAKAGVDLRQYPTPVSAPFEVQQQVANVIPLGRWETKDALKAQYPWATDDMTLGQINKFAGTRQQDPPPEERQPDQWGKPHPDWNLGPGTGAPQDFRLQGPTGIAGILQKFAIPLLAIASGGSAAGLALGITAYTAMSRAATNGQLLEYQINSQKWQTALREHQAQQQMESTDAGDAMAEFADDPAGLQQAMLGIANKYNDPRLRALAEAGDFDAIKRLQARRDMLNQPLMKMKMQYDKMQAEQKLAETRQQIAEAQLEKARTGTPTQQRTAEQIQLVDDAVAADMAQYQKDHPDASPGELAQKRLEFQGERERQVRGGAEAGAGLEGSKLYDIVDDKGNVVHSGVELREAKNKAGFVHAETGAPLELQPGQRVRQTTPTTTTGGRAGAQTLRQLVAAEEVRGDLQGIADLPIGTTIGPSGLVPGSHSVFGATLGTLMRAITDTDQGFMEDSMAGIQRELSTLMSPVYGGKYASDQIDLLTPKPGDSEYRVLDKLGRIRQSADNAIIALMNAPWITPDQKAELDKTSKAMAEAIPWTPQQVRAFVRQGDPNLTFRDFVERGGLATQAPSSGWGTAIPVQ